MALEQVIEKFYEPVEPFTAGNPGKMVSGQLAFVPLTFLEEVPLLLEAERADGKDHSKVTFEIRQIRSADFTKKAKLPVHGLRLGETEECLVARAKKRPCVLITQGCFDGAEKVISASLRSRVHWTRSCSIFVPLYSVKPGTPQGLPPVFVARAKTLVYPQFFHFPNSDIRTSRRSDSVVESIGRLDRLFVSSQHHVPVSPLDIKVTEEAMSILVAMFTEFLGAPLADNARGDLKALRELFQQANPL